MFIGGYIENGREQITQKGGICLHILFYHIYI